MMKAKAKQKLKSNYSVSHDIPNGSMISCNNKKQGKENIELPDVKFKTKYCQSNKKLTSNSRLEDRKLYATAYNSIHYSSHKHKPKHNFQEQENRRIESIKQLYNKKKTQNSIRLEKSILRFVQAKDYIYKTQMLKKKKKKIYSVEEHCKDEDSEVINNFQHQMIQRQQIFQQQRNPTSEYFIKILPNVCYDSQFLFQRQGPCLATMNGKIYLFGGAIRRKFHYLPENTNDFNQDVLFHSYENDHWIRQRVANQLSWYQKNLIYHTVNPVLKKLLVIAGGLIGDTQKTMSKFNQSILVYNPQNKKMVIYPANFNIRSHASVSFDNYVMLHGGVNQQDTVKNSMEVIVVSGGIQNFTIRNYRFQTNQNLVHHQMVSTLGEEKSFRLGLKQYNGIYLFGGEDQCREMNNEIRLLRISSTHQLDKKGIKIFQTLKTYGEAPCGRINHSMNLVPNRNVLVIVGGINKKTRALSDIWLFNLKYHKWTKIQTQPSIDLTFGSLSKHAAISDNNLVYIFGGRQQRNNGSSNFWTIDFNDNVTLKIPKPKRQSQISKISSVWSISKSSNQFQFSDKIIFKD